MGGTYDVANSHDGKTSEDVNDTYDHVFGEQTEDQYDTTVNMNTHILSQNASIFLAVLGQVPTSE
jgi:hypothetical protein